MSTRQEINMFTLSLFGSFSASFSQNPVVFPTERSRALLTYLALYPQQPQSRTNLAELLWDDRIGSDRLSNLRTELSRLRRSLDGLESSLLEVDRNTITFVGDESTVDALHFRALITTCQHHRHAAKETCADCAQRMIQAVALYQDRFLPDLHLEDNLGFEEWVLAQREAFQQLAILALDWVIDYYQRHNQYDSVITYAQRQIALAPWLESAHATLIRAYLLTGERHRALRHYEIMVQTLAAEMDVPPSADLQLLYEQMRAPGSHGHYPAPLPANPYRGLKAFAQEDSPYFFGREKITEQIVKRLAQDPLLMLVGASGCGKSSLLYAGVLPRLVEDQDTTWHLIHFRPGANPFAALAQALQPFLPAAESLVDDLQTRRVGLADLLLTIRGCKKSTPDAERPAQKILVLIDQFEELFSLCSHVAMRQRFLELIVEAVGQRSSQLTILLSMRADFLGQAFGMGSFADAMGSHLLALGAMSRAEMSQAVAKPAQMQGVHFEPGLVERLLNDVGDDAGRLPLLQFTLSRLWHEQHHGWITHRAYEEVEEIAGALNHYANGILARLQLHQQGLAKRIFLQLVQAIDGMDDCRRRGVRGDFTAEEWSVVQSLADARLLVTDYALSTDEEIVELVHEALIHDWHQLHDWLQADRNFRLWQGRVRSQAQQWQRSEGDEGTLLRGLLLAEAEAWLDERRRTKCRR